MPDTDERRHTLAVGTLFRACALFFCSSIHSSRLTWVTFCCSGSQGQEHQIW